MKGFERKNPLFSLCGLNCGLCPMFLGNHCGGCGNGNQSCKIARCSLEHGKVEYCFECPSFPCPQYAHIDDFDSFITHRRRREDLAKAQRIGIEEYTLEQREKMQILSLLLAAYNDGRRKTFFCAAVNLLALSDLQEAISELESNRELASLPLKERSAYAAGVIQKIADEQNVTLKLMREPLNK